MKNPKAPKESAEQKAARETEEQRIKVMQARADAEEAAAGRQLLTRRTRQVMRLFGARRALAGISAGALGATLAPTGGVAFGGASSASFPLGYGGAFGGIGGIGGGGRTVKV